MGYVKEKPVVWIGGRSQAALDYKNGDDRFNFVPKERCENCGGHDIAYSAFNMRDGRLTVMWICRRCGKEAMMRKVRFESNEEPNVRALNDAVLNAYMLDRPSVAKAIQMATVDVEIMCDTLYVRFYFAKKNMLLAKILERKLNDMIQYYDHAACDNDKICHVSLMVLVEGKPMQQIGTMSDSAKATLDTAYDVFHRPMIELVD